MLDLVQREFDERLGVRGTALRSLRAVAMALYRRPASGTSEMGERRVVVYPNEENYISGRDTIDAVRQVPCYAARRGRCYVRGDVYVLLCLQRQAVLFTMDRCSSCFAASR